MLMVFELLQLFIEALAQYALKIILFFSELKHIYKFQAN